MGGYGGTDRRIAVTTATRSARALAADAASLVYVDTAGAHHAALKAVQAAREQRDDRAASAAEVVLGVTLCERGALRPAADHCRRALRLANEADAPELAAEARLGLMRIYALRGDLRAGIREGTKAVEALHGLDRARALTKLAPVLRLEGKLDQALELYGRALKILREDPDKSDLARLYNNRAVTYYYRGSLPEALADFERAERIHLSVGHRRFAAQSRQSWGIVKARLGDLPAALAAFAQADDYFNEESEPDPLALRDRALVLVAARLLAEARAYLVRGVAQLEEAGHKGPLAETRLLLAEAALLDGEPSLAKEEAERARRAFARQRRPAWAAIARSLVVQAAWEGGERSQSILGSARRAADELERAGFVIQAVDARLLAGRMALELGRVAVAREELEITRRARSRGPVDVRLRAWHAEALMRLEDGNRRGARSALRAGMEMLDRYRTALGATDLRVHAARYGRELAALGGRLAIEDGDPAQVLAWSERCRAVSLRPRPVRPPRDARLAKDLTEIRRVRADIEEAALAGRSTVRLVARQAALEDRVRDRARHASGPHAPEPGSVPGRAELASALGDRVLVELVECEEQLYAVVVTPAWIRLVPLASRSEVVAELEQLRFSLRRLASTSRPSRSQDASFESLRFGLKRLDGLLMAPLAAQLDVPEVVVVPTGALHAVPWAALPSLAWRGVVVSPSASVWHAAATATAAVRRASDVVLVAGPGLGHASAEVAALASVHGGARVLTGQAATTEAVLAAMDGASLAHIAAHGRFRADNPLFSCLELVDGPLTVYDLEGLTHVPETLVLAACDSGVSDVQPGDELMGLTASLLALGTHTIVASIGPVPDQATRDLMSHFHAGVAAGLGPAAALARAQAALASRGPAHLAAAAGFLCFGAG